MCRKYDQHGLSMKSGVRLSQLEISDDHLMHVTDMPTTRAAGESFTAATAIRAREVEVRGFPACCSEFCTGHISTYGVAATAAVSLFVFAHMSEHERRCGLTARFRRTFLPSIHPSD